MRISLGKRFQQDVRKLSDDDRRAVCDAMLGLPRAIGNPHAHAGLGLRKVHVSGIWEARVGLGLRLLFALRDDTLTLVRVATHDEVRRFLREL